MARVIKAPARQYLNNGQVRLLSAAAIFALIAASIVPLLIPGLDQIANVVRAGGMMLASLVLAQSIGARIPAPGELDEREQAERVVAMAIGFRTTATLLGLIAAYVLLASAITSISLWQPSLRQLGWLLLSLFWLHMILPSTVIAWRNPTPEEE